MKMDSSRAVRPGGSIPATGGKDLELSPYNPKSIANLEIMFQLVFHLIYDPPLPGIHKGLPIPVGGP